MTKELLYIPNGSYLTFYIKDEKHVNLGEFEKFWSMTTEKIIDSILISKFKEEFFVRNNLPKAEFLDKSHFEIVVK